MTLPNQPPRARYYYPNGYRIKPERGLEAMNIRSLFTRRDAGPEAVRSTTELTPSELFLLSLFLKPRLRETITGPGWNDVWRGSLGQEPSSVLDSFLRQGLLRPCDGAEKLDVRFRVPELVELCKRHGLPQKGKKAELIARLVEGVSSTEITALTSDVHPLRCSDSGATLAEAYRRKADAARQEAEDSCIDALHRGELAQACQIVRRFEARQPIPRGMGVDWSNPDISHELGLLVALFQNTLPSTAPLTTIAAAMSLLWGTGPEKWLPKEPSDSGKRRRRTPEEKAAEVAARMEAFRANHERTLEGYRANRDVIIAVEILAAQSSCDFCKKQVGHYPLDSVPPLPHADCTHDMGCRCVYVPVTRFSDL